MFICLALQGRCWSIGRLPRHGVPHNTMFPLYNHGLETTQHPPFHDIFWHEVLAWCRLTASPSWHHDDFMAWLTSAISGLTAAYTEASPLLPFSSLGGYGSNGTTMSSIGNAPPSCAPYTQSRMKLTTCGHEPAKRPSSLYTPRTIRSRHFYVCVCKLLLYHVISTLLSMKTYTKVFHIHGENLFSELYFSINGDFKEISTDS